MDLSCFRTMTTFEHHGDAAGSITSCASMCSTSSSIIGNCVVGCCRNCSKCGVLSPVSTLCGMIRIRPMSYSEREKTLDRLRIKAVSSVKSSGNPSIRHWMRLYGSSATGLSVGGGFSVAAVASVAGVSVPAAVVLALTVVMLDVATRSRPAVGDRSVCPVLPADTDNILTNVSILNLSDDSSPDLRIYSAGSARARQYSAFNSNDWS